MRFERVAGTLGASVLAVTLLAGASGVPSCEPTTRAPTGGDAGAPDAGEGDADALDAGDELCASLVLPEVPATMDEEARTAAIARFAADNRARLSASSPKQWLILYRRCVRPIVGG